MTEKQAIKLLRSALASIWSECDCEEDSACVNNCFNIAMEALNLTIEYATKGKDLTDDSIGIEHWNKIKNKYAEFT